MTVRPSSPPDSAASRLLGTLYLVPTPLDFGCHAGGEPPAPLGELLPASTVAVAACLSHWITESAKSTRAFLKRVDGASGLARPLQAMQISELPRDAHKKGDHAPGASDDAAARQLLAPALQGHDIGLVSEAGMPAIADPGSSIVRAAHAMGLSVVPLVGPISLMLALAASGLNGQSFAFAGYVPQAPAARAQRLRELEAIASKIGQTQILIETPYRNAALLQTLIQTLRPETRLAVCCGLTLPQQQTRSALVSHWRQAGQKSALSAPPLQLDAPSIFLFGR